MRVARYTLQDEIGASGSQSDVYFGARDDGLPVAMKVAHPGPAFDKSLREELALMKRLGEKQVWGVVPILDAFKVQGRPAMVMPRYKRHLGEWLQEVIKSPGPGTLAQILSILSEVARTLSEVHAVQEDGGLLVHRDIKPENIFLDDHNRPWLGDFGGAMAVAELRAVELALFGTPLWAPLDQLLPGTSIPDPTWDTYALCVIVYAAFTGARPAYQANPKELLTDRGHKLWAAARTAIEADTDARPAAYRAFANARMGTRASDLLDPTGRAALLPGDRSALDTGVRRLAGLAGLSDDTAGRLLNELWDLLVRGLSPLSHPSPPNRFRDAEDLARALRDLGGVISSDESVTGEITRKSLTALLYDERSAPSLVPREAPARSGWGLMGTALTLGGLALAALAAGAAYLAREPIELALAPYLPPPAQVQVAAGSVSLPTGPHPVAAFTLAGTEATVAQWRACVVAHACPERFQPHGDAFPATGLSAEDARALCAHLGGRLPTEPEWLLAHGPDDYPWGSAPPDCGRATGRGCEPTPAPVAAARIGRAASGALDLAGNAWEWVDGADGPVLVGGGASSGPKELGRGGRWVLPADSHEPLAGVRCAFSAAAR